MNEPYRGALTFEHRLLTRCGSRARYRVLLALSKQNVDVFLGSP